MHIHDDKSHNGVDRRIYNHLRAYFEDACLITTPFLDAKQGLDGMPMKLSALQSLRNRFPELQQQDLAILFSAVQDFHGKRQRR